MKFNEKLKVGKYFLSKAFLHRSVDYIKYVSTWLYRFNLVRADDDLNKGMHIGISEE